MKIALVFCQIDDVFNSYPAGVFSIFESNPPLGLAAIGTTAKLRGHDVKIFDQLLLHDSKKDFIERILRFSPDLVGFSCTSLNIDNSEYCAKVIKDKCGCIVFAGGIHITLCTRKVLEKNIFDFLISGEGEEVFNSILSELEKYRTIDNMSCMNGLWRKEYNNDQGIAVLDKIDQPIISRDIMDIHLYKNKGALLEETPCYSIFSSRGCPYSCQFCSKPSYFKIYRCRKIENVIKEIHYLVKNCDGKAISFREDNFTVDRNRLSFFCDAMIKEFNGELFWECESRADMPRDLLKKMYRAGCRGIWCGVETIVPKWSNWIKKELNKDSVVHFYQDCYEIGIKTGALFMFGFPFQTVQELEEDISFAISLPTKFSAFQCLAIFPASPLLEFYKQNPTLYHKVTDDVFLALTKGKTYQEMIKMEHEINKRIQSSRLFYK